MIECDQLLYVMWSRTTRQVKVGISNAPDCRASQIRKSRKDDSIKVMAAWAIEAPDPSTGAALVEYMAHRMLAPLQSEPRIRRRRRLRHYGEWFDMRWPAALASVESLAQLIAPAGLRMRRISE